MKFLGTSIDACPVCRNPIKLEDLVQLCHRKPETVCRFMDPFITICIIMKESSPLEGNFRMSGKLLALREEVQDMITNGSADSKCVVFSQWSTMLDLVEVLNDSVFFLHLW